MTRTEAEREACRIVALAYHSIGDYEHASDGFCGECQYHRQESDYRNDGKAIDFVRVAVVEKLKREGIPISDCFDAETGREIK